MISIIFQSWNVVHNSQLLGLRLNKWKQKMKRYARRIWNEAINHDSFAWTQINFGKMYKKTDGVPGISMKQGVAYLGLVHCFWLFTGHSKE